MDEEPVIVAVVGMTCSGKSTVSEQIKKEFGENCNILHQDNFYKTGKDGDNFDIPSALDMEKIIKKVKQIKKGQNVKIPQYDFATHKRLEKKLLFETKPIIIVEGILLFCNEELLNLFDIKVYIKSNAEITRNRRLERDVKERGRTRESVIKQYDEHVIPSIRQYVEPSKIHATHLLIDKYDFTFAGMDTLLAEINKRVGFVTQ